VPRNLDYTPAETRVPLLFKIIFPPCMDVEAKIRHRRAATRTSLPPPPPPCIPSVCPARPARSARLLAIPCFGRANPPLGATRARHPSFVLPSPFKHLVLTVLPSPLGDGRSVTFGVTRAGWVVGRAPPRPGPTRGARAVGRSPPLVGAARAGCAVSRAPPLVGAALAGCVVGRAPPQLGSTRCARSVGRAPPLVGAARAGCAVGLAPR